METRHPAVLVGSYPSFLPSGSEVEVVLKSTDPAALAAAVAWIEPALDAAPTRSPPVGGELRRAGAPMGKM